MGNTIWVNKVKKTTSYPSPAVPKIIRGPNNNNNMDPALATSISKFAMRFCNEREKDRSFVCSPLSAQCVLALTALGCAGASLNELLAAMELSDDKTIRSTFAFLTSTLQSVEGVNLRIANKVYVTKTGALKPAMQKDAMKLFGSGVEQLDFSKNVAAAALINKWVAELSPGMITNVVSPGSLNADRGLLLINAIYFQGLWEYKFSEELTKDRTFHLNKTKKIMVPMMCETDCYLRYKNSPELKAKILQLDYQGGQSSLVIVLPNDVEGLGNVMQKIAAGHDLMGEIAGVKRKLLDIFIPKFKIETEIDLRPLLKKMGIKSIFNKATSDIRMLTSGQRLYVSEAMQKAVIEVDEKGTKAAACTCVRMVPRSASYCPPKPQIFNANRPFLYLLTARQIPLFIGVYHGKEFAVPPT